MCVIFRDIGVFEHVILREGMGKLEEGYGTLYGLLLQMTH